MVDYKLNGKLQMTDDQTGEFEMVSEDGIGVNVSKILNDIFESSLKPQVYVRVSKGTSLIIEEDGGLFFNTDKQKVNSYFVCGINLSKTLWDNTDQFLEIEIKERSRGISVNNDRIK